jgi:hypothetical protein
LGRESLLVRIAARLIGQMGRLIPARRVTLMNGYARSNYRRSTVRYCLPDAEPNHLFRDLHRSFRADKEACDVFHLRAHVRHNSGSGRYFDNRRNDDRLFHN